MSFLDSIWDQVQIWRRSIDRWVAQNVSPQTQKAFIFVLIFVMVIHLVYTKRKLTREELERRSLERKKQEKKEK